MEAAQRFAGDTGAKFTVTHNMDEAFKGAHIVYPKSWGCHQHLKDVNMPEADKKETGMKILNKYKNWVCTVGRMKMAHKDAVYMHPLPADRGAEVEDAVIDVPQSVVFDQAENRLHTVKAILALIMGGRP